MKRFYSTVDPDPIVYWVFDSAILYDAQLEYVPNTGGDECHINAKNLSDEEAGKIFAANFRHDDCRICLNGTDQPFTIESLQLS